MNNSNRHIQNNATLNTKEQQQQPTDSTTQTTTSSNDAQDDKRVASLDGKYRNNK